MDHGLVSLRMYDLSAGLKAAHRRWWDAVADRLDEAGWFMDVEYNDNGPHDAAWLQSDLLLSQTCGYPLVTSLAGKVQLVATPLYLFPGGRGTDRCSFLVCRADDSATRLEDFRDRRVAINALDSNSGFNLLRASVAPLGRDGRFFASRLVTGGHLSSLDAVRTSSADLAAIDSVTFGLAARDLPDRVTGLRILGETPYGPGLPLITSLATPPQLVDDLRLAIHETATLPEIAAPLGLVGIAELTVDDYGRLLDLAKTATAAGYPDVA